MTGQESVNANDKAGVISATPLWPGLIGDFSPNSIASRLPIDPLRIWVDTCDCIRQKVVVSWRSRWRTAYECRTRKVLNASSAADRTADLDVAMRPAVVRSNRSVRRELALGSRAVVAVFISWDGTQGHRSRINAKKPANRLIFSRLR